MSEGLSTIYETSCIVIKCNKCTFIGSNQIKLYHLKKPSTFNLFPCSHTWFSTLYSTRVTRVRASQCCPQSLDVNLCGVLPLRLSSARFFFLRYPYNRAWVSTGGKGAWHPRNFWTVMSDTHWFWQFYYIMFCFTLEFWGFTSDCQLAPTVSNFQLKPCIRYIIMMNLVIIGSTYCTALNALLCFYQIILNEEDWF